MLIPTYAFGDEGKWFYGPNIRLELLKFTIIFLNLYLLRSMLKIFFQVKRLYYIFLSVFVFDLFFHYL